MPLGGVSAPTWLNSAWAGRPRPPFSPNSARHLPCLSFPLLERGAPNPEAQLRPTRFPGGGANPPRPHPGPRPLRAALTTPYLRGGPRRHPPGRPGDPRPACVPPDAPAPRRWAALCAQGQCQGASAGRDGKWGGGWRAGRQLPPPPLALRLPFQPLPLARARTRTRTRAHTRAPGAGPVGPQPVSGLCKFAFHSGSFLDDDERGSAVGEPVSREGARGGLPGGSTGRLPDARLGK